MRATFSLAWYETKNLLRSRWLLAFAAFFFLTTEGLFRFGSDPTKILVSLVNVFLLVIPLIALLFGLSYFYHSREFIELLLAQPLARRSIFFGKLFALGTALSVAFLLASLLPFLLRLPLLRQYAVAILTLLGVGFLYLWIFLSLAFLIATLFEDKVKALGLALFLWLYLALLYDALLFLAISVFHEYPFEGPLLAFLLFNPLDLGRILLLLQFDISALLGYTGASVERLLGSSWGSLLAFVLLLLWAALPTALGQHFFRKKDF